LSGARLYGLSESKKKDVEQRFLSQVIEQQTNQLFPSECTKPPSADLKRIKQKFV
jgi:hypothetical protein